MPCHAMPCHPMPPHAPQCHAMPCHAMPCHAMPRRRRYMKLNQAHFLCPMRLGWRCHDDEARRSQLHEQGHYCPRRLKRGGNEPVGARHMPRSRRHPQFHDVRNLREHPFLMYVRADRRGWRPCTRALRHLARGRSCPYRHPWPWPWPSGPGTAFDEGCKGLAGSMSSCLRCWSKQPRLAAARRPNVAGNQPAGRKRARGRSWQAGRQRSP